MVTFQTMRMQVANIAATNQLTLISLHHLAHGIVFHKMDFNANRIIYKRKKLSSQLHANAPVSHSFTSLFHSRSVDKNATP